MVAAQSLLCCYGHNKLSFTAPGENELPVDLRYTIYCTTIANGKDSDWLFLWNRYRNVANSPSEKKTLLSALSCSTEIWTLQVNNLV